MIDFSTYDELHPHNAFSNALASASTTRANLPMGDKEPKAPEIYLFPSRVPGFDLRHKKWGEYLLQERDYAFSH
jgi:hypothetical protein